ncbi:hypothetical protein CspeluHIS016_0200610 [Cutaneotrichosporon spelunceum]|uniref:Protein phosphatase methylesterase 1 n=1 Tax=Cutaneotrichosporon spelunceum TaxID=1672016 RepID=A0AAD3TQJ1_9TREE|nr:hypothetical protein CspeluHIS016_0200610 [Cutaneotrichosporon spelunceum]
MSDEFRRSILNRLPQMVQTRAPWAEPTNDEDEEEELDEVGELMPVPMKKLEPLSASEFFMQALEVVPPGRDTTFRAYLSPPTASPAPNQRNKQGSYLFCHHGGGAGALGFAPLAKEVLARSGGELGVFAYDARGHGKTRGGNDKDLSLQTLLDDLVAVVEQMWDDPKTAPALILLGHSMGAAPIVHAAPVLQDKGYTIAGVCVLDAVEGTAIESLHLMKAILSKRPTSFPSVAEAIGWHVTSGTIRNETSARVSVPSLVVPSGNAVVWRTDLLATEPYWEDWYTGLSQKFLAVKCARFLCLARQDRLDRDLMVGQMQGKFQQEVMQDVGHYLHEDDPATLAKTLVTFWRRNTTVLVLPAKIGAGRVEAKHVGQQ